MNKLTKSSKIKMVKSLATDGIHPQVGEIVIIDEIDTANEEVHLEGYEDFYPMAYFEEIQKRPGTSPQPLVKTK